MKTIIRIARFELSSLFFSPIAWLLMVAFFFQTALSYTDLIDQIDRFMKLNFTRFFDQGFTFYVFGHPMFGVMKNVLDYMYLYIPLLSMGLISKELSSGSIKLLMSSPLKARDIVLGKFLAIVGYALLMAGALVIFMLVGGLTIASADFGIVISGIIGFVLLVMAYGAIGLFFSSLTSYQIVAGIAAIVVLGFLNYVGRLWQDIPVVSEITYWLSISGRAIQMTMGLISSADLAYFLVITFMFLAFTEIKINSGRQITSVWNKMGKYLGLFGAAALVAYVSSVPALTGYVDMTKTKWRTLTDGSKEVMDKIEGPVKMTQYVNIFDESAWSAMPRSQKRDMDRFDNYQRYAPQLEFEYVYFYDTIIGSTSYTMQENQGKPLAEIANQTIDAWELDRSLIKTPAQMDEIIDLEPENNQFVRTIEANGKRAFVRMFDDQRQYPSENETSATFKKLVTQAPNAVFVTGHGERSFSGIGDRDYSHAMVERTYREAMIQKGFDFQNVNLAQQDLPGNIAFLVIAGPKTPYSEAELAKIRSFYNGGGSLIVMGETDYAEAIQPIYDMIGIVAQPGKLLQKNEGLDDDFILADFTDDALVLNEEVEFFLSRNRIVTMPNATSVKYTGSGFESKTFLTVDAAKTQLATESDTTAFGGDMAIALSKGQQRILVFGDSDLYANTETNRNLNNTNRNEKFVNFSFGWMTHGEFPVNTWRPEVPDKEVKLGDTAKTVARYSVIGVIPFILIAFGSVILLRRKRK